MNLIKPNPNYHFVLVAGALKYGRPAGRKPDLETLQFQLIKNVWENIEDLEDVDLMSDQVLRKKLNLSRMRDSSLWRTAGHPTARN